MTALYRSNAAYVRFPRCRGTIESMYQVEIDGEFVCLSATALFEAWRTSCPDEVAHAIALPPGESCAVSSRPEIRVTRLS
jgi:hypothetical protein